MNTGAYRYIIFFLASWVLFSCHTELKPAKTESEPVKEEYAFKNFHDHFQAGNFDLLDKDLDDSIRIFDLYGQSVNREKYLTDIRNWGSVFNTQWRIVNSTRSGDTTRSVEYDSDQKNNYLYGGDLHFQFTYIEKNNKLVYLKWDSLPGMSDVLARAKMRYSLFESWVKKYYPDNYPSLSYKTKDAYSLEQQMLSEFLRTPEGREARIMEGQGR